MGGGRGEGAGRERSSISQAVAMAERNITNVLDRVLLGHHLDYGNHLFFIYFKGCQPDHNR